MTGTPKKPKPDEIEIRPDGWERFENTVDAAVKSGPKHRVTTNSPKRRKATKKTPE